MIFNLCASTLGNGFLTLPNSPNNLGITSKHYLTKSTNGSFLMYLAANSF